MRVHTEEKTVEEMGTQGVVGVATASRQGMGVEVELVVDRRAEDESGEEGEKVVRMLFEIGCTES